MFASTFFEKNRKNAFEQAENWSYFKYIYMYTLRGNAKGYNSCISNPKFNS
jgi:hypothetical protein